MVDPRRRDRRWTRCARWTHQRDEAGATTTVMLTLIAFLLLASSITGLAVATVSTHRHAQAAADLAALAAMVAHQSGGAVCAAARVNATANGVRLEECRAGPDRVDVVVSIAGPVDGLTGRLRARARAGTQTAVG